MKIDIAKFKQYQKDGWLKSQTHPELPLIIWNYTPNTQYEGKWDDVTRLARGLVTDTKGNVIAHPFKKFFNYSELKAWGKVPTGDFTINEKLDGSYIQVFDYQGEIVVSSKGSFTSIQVEMATGILDQEFADWGEVFDPQYNYIFELIHPNNRIVLDYGMRTTLVLLGLIDKNGVEADPVDYGAVFNLPKTYGVTKDFEKLQSTIQDNEEGYVLVFDSGERMKIKGEEYLRLHRIVTHTSSKDIWIALKENKDLQELVDRTPDEWTTWVYRTIGELYVKRRNILFQMLRDLAYGQEKGLYNINPLNDTISTLETTRRKVAEYFNTCQYPKLMFMLLDNQNVDEKIWDMVKPEFQKGFSI